MVGGLIEVAVLADAIGRRHPGHAALQTNRLVTLPLVIERGLDRVGDRRAIGMAIDHAALACRAAEQLIDRQARELALDVRSEERRVGKEGVSTGSYRWAPFH